MQVNGQRRSRLRHAWIAYRLRLKRKKLLFRAFRSRRQLTLLANQTGKIASNDILLVSTMRNEIARLPWFLQHYRRMGVGHFLIVENNSNDGTREFLLQQSDVSLWTTDSSYKNSRFGMNWLNWLLRRYGQGHWCITVDADETLIYPDWQARALPELTGWLDKNRAPYLAAVMLDLYPKGALGASTYRPGTDPTKILDWFDPHNYTWELQDKYRNISIRGGVRKRVFFSQNPEHAPHLHKTPLIKWHRSYVYVSSTHIALPRSLNAGLDMRSALPIGVLLHTKFMDGVLDKSEEEKRRREHFTHTERYDTYYDRIIDDPVLWDENSVRFENWQQLERLGLLFRGKWLCK